MGKVHCGAQTLCINLTNWIDAIYEDPLDEIDLGEASLPLKFTPPAKPSPDVAANAIPSRRHISKKWENHVAVCSIHSRYRPVVMSPTYVVVTLCM